MNNDEQFQKYASLDSSLFKLSTLDEKKITSNLVGKPTKIWKDILKRYFTNYTAVIALIIFLIVILVALLVPIFSKYSAFKTVYPIGNFWTQSLPPVFSPIVEEQVSNSELSLFVETFQNKDLFPNFNLGDNNLSDYSSDALNDLFVNGSNGIIQKVIILPEKNFLVTYNKYDMIRAQLSLNEQFNGASESISTIFGTDNQGYDIWTRTWTATRESLVLALTVVLIESVIGITIGSYLGFFVGTWIDTILTRFIDVIKNVPMTLWFLIFISFFPVVNFSALLISLVIIGWTAPVYLTRIWIITVKDLEFIQASKSIGARTNRLVFLHALPMIIGKLLTSFVWRIVSVILLVSALSFLGFVPITGNSANLGRILQNAIGQSKLNMWALALPAMILLFVSLSAQFIANGIHDALDPKVLKGAN